MKQFRFVTFQNSTGPSNRMERGCGSDIPNPTAHLGEIFPVRSHKFLPPAGVTRETRLSPETEGRKVAGLVRQLSRKKCSFKRIVWIYFELFRYNKKPADGDSITQIFGGVTQTPSLQGIVGLLRGRRFRPSAPAHKSSGVESVEKTAVATLRPRHEDSL